jgi:hypothetical protein
MVPAPAMDCNIKALHEQLDEIIDKVRGDARDGASAHAAEANVFKFILAMGHKLFELFLTMVGPGDLGEILVLEDGRQVKRLGLHERPLLTTLGEFAIIRFVYGSRESQKFELAPTDQRLQLPESKSSYVLQDLDQTLGTDHPFRTGVKTVEKTLGLKQSVDTLERGNRQMAEAAPAFRAAQPAPDPLAEGQFLVASDDNKGVPMVRPADAAPAGVHRKKGEKANKKQMACIGCVYTVDPHVRTPLEVIDALFRDPDRKRSKGPQASQKRYWAELSREEKGQIVKA